MSTRCQILFVREGEYKTQDGKKKTWREEAQIYRHSDGYPSAVIPDLYEFYQWNTGRNDDVSYLAANFIFYMKRKGEEKYDISGAYGKPHDYKSVDGNDIVQLGYGVEKTNHKLHGDEEWLYRVTITGKSENDTLNWVVAIARVTQKNQTFDNAKYEIEANLRILIQKTANLVAGITFPLLT
jgi:hypothetical protein